MNAEEFENWRISYGKRNYNSLVYPLIMGILNVTSDSFFDGGKFLDIQSAVEHAFYMISKGVDIIDIGGESTRPGYTPISVDEELSRVIPVIKKIRSKSDICISIDTTKLVVMYEALLAGASFINDVSSLSNKDSLKFVSSINIPVCLMHGFSGYHNDIDYHNNVILDDFININSGKKDIVDDIDCFFEQKIADCINVGIQRKNLIIDPGFGFNKSVKDNLRIINSLNKFSKYNLPILIGLSRKSTLGILLNKLVNERLIGSIVMSILSILQGVSIIRTHDVDEMNQALIILKAVKQEISY
ncbi:dihydropteroate synthase [Candidatus Legionella polyplacis]|uniref:Dihydropteroate synthase n=1 Tax=Candidatus Legionella polyplacis TaxID=2005262 RepID=A0ABZ2GXT2_9GAMM